MDLMHQMLTKASLHLFKSLVFTLITRDTINLSFLASFPDVRTSSDILYLGSAVEDSSNLFHRVTLSRSARHPCDVIV